MSKLTFKLALGFLKSKKYGPLARFMSLASTLGISIGVCSLILGLSAMNGFERELKNRVLELVPSITLTSYEPEGYTNIKNIVSTIKQTKHVVSVNESIVLKGAITDSRSFVPAMIIGVNSDEKQRVINFEKFTKEFSDDILSKPKQIILGNGIAKKLNVKKGDTIKVACIDKADNAAELSAFNMQDFTVAGVFKTAGQIDNNFAFISLDAALEISNREYPNTIHIKTDDMLIVNNVAYDIARVIPQESEITTWLDTHGKLYKDINMIRGIMYLAMILVICVACFNIISNLVMTVNEKRKEIAILMTMGADKKFIIKTFTLMGLLGSFKGCAYGIIAGTLISLFTPYVTANFEKWTSIQLLNEDVYFINFVPTEIHITDIATVGFCALIMGTLAALYPAVKAANTNIVEEINSN